MKKMVVLAAMLLIAAGCATNRIDWNARVGNYTYDQAVLELGPPENMATLTDGTRVGDWLTSRGRSMGGGFFISRGYMVHHFPDSDGPDRYMRLTFDPQGRLMSFQRVLK